MKKELCIMQENPPYWRDIKGYEGFYKISSNGDVYSVRNNKIMKKNIRNGYYQIGFKKHGTRKCFQIHRLVAEHFIDNPNNKAIVNHKDFNPLNNNVENLEWVTQKENVLWSICNMKHRRKVTHTNTGEKYIYYRENGNHYRVVVDKKEHTAKTLEEAIRLRDELL